MYVLSFVIMGTGLLSMFIAGLPIADLILCRHSKSLEYCRDYKWALAPFMGFGVIVAVQKIFVGFNIPIMYSAWPVFIISLAGFVYYIHKHYRGKNRKDFLPSKYFSILFLAILALAGSAYFMSDPSWYRGYHADDMWVYGQLMEALRVIPISSFAESTDRYVWGVYAWVGGLIRPSITISII